MSNISLMSLPYVPRVELCKKMSIFELTSMSSKNSEFCDFLRSLRIHLAGFKVSIDEFGWRMETTKRGYCHYAYSHNKWESARFFVSALARLQKSFLSQEVHSIELSPSMTKNLLAYKDKLPKSCHILVVTPNEDSEFDESEYYAHPVPDLIEDQKKIKEEERENLDQLLNSINIKDALILATQQEPMAEKIYSVDSLAIQNSEWFTASHLTRLQNRIVCLDNTMMSDKDINSFLKDLKTGIIKNQLEVLVVNGNFEDPDWNMNVVLEGLEAERVGRNQQYFIAESKKFSMLKDNLYEPFLSNEMDLSNAHDFIREDGTRCSILIKGNKLGLYVWNQQQLTGTKRRMDDSEDFRSAPEAKKNRIN